MITKKKQQKYRISLYWGIPFILVTYLSLVIILPEPKDFDGFSSLSDLQIYASNINEHIHMENDNAKTPNFDSYYEEHFIPSAFNDYILKCRITTGNYCKILRKPSFSPHFFKTLLEAVTHDRKTYNLQSPLIQKIDCTTNATFVIFGAIQGAFHSLVRNLEQLKKLDLIDESLHVRHPKTFFVFLGNAIIRSPFGLETFGTMLRLMYNNPTNVIYLKGTQEHEKAWLTQSLKKELTLRCSNVSAEQVPLEKEINDFFNTLPYAFYVTIPFTKVNDQIPTIRMTPSFNNEQIANLISEKNYAHFLEKSSNQLSSHSLAQPLSPHEGLNRIKHMATITEIRKKYDYVQTDGLRLLSTSDGIATWTVFSSPTHPAHVVLNFFNDAFAVLKPKEQLNDWTITLYNHDIRNKNTEFQTRKEIFFVTNDL